jgi:hypothetical protein
MSKTELGSAFVGDTVVSSRFPERTAYFETESADATM